MAQILGLSSGAPLSRRTFSGSARQLFLALQRRGVLHGASDVDLPRPLRLATRALEVVRSRRVAAHRLRARWSSVDVELRSRRAAARLSGAGATSALLYGTDFFPAVDGGRASVPVGAALDATFAQIARAGEHDFAHLTPLEVSDCVARQRSVFDRCDVLLPRTEWCAASLEEDYGVPYGRLVVTGAGPNFDEAPAVRDGYDGRTLLFVGRDWQRKNGPLVLDAFRAARRARPELRLVVVGPPGEPLREDGVEWIGALDGARRGELRALFARASLYLCPSRFEPFGIALLEAMASGCPVVSLDRGAAREIVEDGRTGSLLPDDAPSTLASAILDWTSDADRLAAAGERCRAAVDRRWGWDRAARRVEEALGEGGFGPVLQPQRPRAPRVPAPLPHPAPTAILGSD